MDLKKLSQLLTNLVDQLGGDASAAELARKMGANPGTLRAYLRQEVASPRMDTLQLIADYMGVELDALIKQLSEDTPTQNIRVADTPAPNNVTTFSELTPTLDRLNPKDALKVISYLSSRLITA